MLTESCESAESSLAAWAWGPRPNSTLSSDFNMQTGNPKFLESCNNIVSSEKSLIHQVYQLIIVTCISRRFFVISFYLHTTCNTAERFSSSQISDMNECIVETRIYMAVTEDILLRLSGWTNLLIFFVFLSFFLGWL